MKFRTYLVAAVILAAIIAVGLNFKPKPPGGGTKPKDADMAVAGIPPRPTVLEAAAVDEISISSPGGGSTVELRKIGGGWIVASLDGAPADAAKVERLVGDVFHAFGADAAKMDGIDAAQAGLAENQGVAVVVRNGGTGLERALCVGFSPPGDPLAAYAMEPDGDVLLARSDLRGDLGVWENAPSPVIPGDHWLSRTVFAADPADVAKIEFADGNQRLTLEKNESGWRPAGGGPKNGQAFFDAAAAADWAKALSWFVPGAIAPADARREMETAEKYVVTAGLADGSSATFTAWKDESDAILVVASTAPGLTYRMPEWRFDRYFQRFFDIFPGRNPRFDPAEVRFADIRRDGDSVKFALRDGIWSAVGVTYPLRVSNLRSWIEAVSRWRPDGFAQGGPSPRVPQDAPTIEIILASGDVRQYRLGGETEAGGARYVLVDGDDLFLTGPAAAETLFPETAALFYLGATFLGVDPDAIREASIFEEGMERPAVVRRDGAGGLSIETGDGVATVYPETAKTFLDAPLLWRVAGTYKGDAAVFDAPRLTLRFEADGAERSLVLAPPTGGRYPALRDGRDAFLVDADEVDSWLTVFHVARPLPAEPPADLIEPEPPRDAPEPEEELPPPEPAVTDAIEAVEDGVSGAEKTGTESPPPADAPPIPSDEPVAMDGGESRAVENADEPAENTPLPDVPESGFPAAPLDAGAAAEPPDDSGEAPIAEETRETDAETGGESLENADSEAEAEAVARPDLEGIVAY